MSNKKSIQVRGIKNLEKAELKSMKAGEAVCGSGDVNCTQSFTFTFQVRLGYDYDHYSVNIKIVL